jgi:hypothetical protein
MTRWCRYQLTHTPTDAHARTHARTLTDARADRRAGARRTPGDGGRRGARKRCVGVRWRARRGARGRGRCRRCRRRCELNTELQRLQHGWREPARRHGDGAAAGERVRAAGGDARGAGRQGWPALRPRARDVPLQGRARQGGWGGPCLMPAACLGRHTHTRVHARAHIHPSRTHTHSHRPHYHSLPAATHEHRSPQSCTRSGTRCTRRRAVPSVAIRLRRPL